MKAEYDCGELTPSSPVPRIRRLADKTMQEMEPGMQKWLWETAGFGSFGERRGWQGRIADYLEKYCGFWQEKRPSLNYQ